MKTEGQNTEELVEPGRTRRFSLNEASDRWKWMAVSSAAVGVGAATSATGGQVQIELTGNSATFIGGVLTDNINGDITGDGKNDLPDLTVATVKSGGFGVNYLAFTGTMLRVGSRRFVPFSSSTSTGTVVGYNFGVAAYASRLFTTSTISSFIASVAGGAFTYSTSRRNGTPNDVTGFVPVTFQDSRINKGARTSGFVQVRAFNTATDEHAVEFVRLIFNDSSTSFGSPPPMTATVYPEFVPTNPATITKLKRQIKKLQKRQKKLKRAGKASAARRIAKKVRKLKKRLRLLC